MNAGVVMKNKKDEEEEEDGVPFIRSAGTLIGVGSSIWMWGRVSLRIAIGS